jgi:hypothetical protein
MASIQTVQKPCTKSLTNYLSSTTIPQTPTAAAMTMMMTVQPGNSTTAATNTIANTVVALRLPLQSHPALLVPSADWETMTPAAMMPPPAPPRPNARLKQEQWLRSAIAQKQAVHCDELICPVQALRSSPMESGIGERDYSAFWIWYKMIVKTNGIAMN